jgi:hypothetical protein
MQEKKVIERGGLYNRANPPPSEEVALARIRDIEISVQSCAAQLEFGNPDEFDTDEEFYIWKDKTTKALAHYQTEVQFLYRWVRGGKPGLSNGESYRVALEAITGAVARMTKEMSGAYTCIYTGNNPPPDLTTAQARKEELASLNFRFQALFQELKGKEKLPSGDEIAEHKMRRLKSPLSKLFSAMSAESKLLGDFIKENQPQVTADANDTEKRVDWTLFLLGLVDRGLEAGVVLTDVEGKLLKHIRDYKKAQVEIANKSVA